MDIISSLHGMGPALLDATGQGVLWGIMVLGVYITYKLLDIADLTVDGSFALGGCVCAVLISKEVSPAGALLLAALAGMAAGFVTGILHTVFEIPSILAGILTQISLWSINLWIMGDKSNVSLKGEYGYEAAVLHDGADGIPSLSACRRFYGVGGGSASLLVFWNGNRLCPQSYGQ